MQFDDLVDEYDDFKDTVSKQKKFKENAESLHVVQLQKQTCEIILLLVQGCIVDRLDEEHWKSVENEVENYA